jgi:hypothetical protein
MTVGKKRPEGQNFWKDKTFGRPNVQKTKHSWDSGGTKRSEKKDPFGLFSIHTFLKLHKQNFTE